MVVTHNRFYSVAPSHDGSRAWAGRPDGRDDEVVVALVSLVSVWARNWYYLCGIVERVAECETVEIASIHAVFTQVAENMLG